MILKSMSRKTPSFHALVGYMDRKRSPDALLHNMYGNDRMRQDDIIRLFEENAGHLKARHNGNYLYHEVLSLASGHRL